MKISSYIATMLLSTVVLIGCTTLTEKFSKQQNNSVENSSIKSENIEKKEAVDPIEDGHEKFRNSAEGKKMAPICKKFESEGIKIADKFASLIKEIKILGSADYPEARTNAVNRELEESNYQIAKFYEEIKTANCEAFVSQMKFVPVLKQAFEQLN